MYQQLLEFYIRKAYEMEGISLLSAQSKKPAGADSGVALQTLEDVESERFQYLLDNYINFYTNIVKTAIEVFPADDDILPQRYNRSGIKWKEIKKQKELINFQFSNASSLSKDPATKLAQLKSLADMGLIDQFAVAKYLELPDIEAAFDRVTDIS